MRKRNHPLLCILHMQLNIIRIEVVNAAPAFIVQERNQHLERKKLLHRNGWLACKPRQPVHLQHPCLQLLHHILYRLNLVILVYVHSPFIFHPFVPLFIQFHPLLIQLLQWANLNYHSRMMEIILEPCIYFCTDFMV